ncbi:MAG: hypothetical protein HFH06_12475 [Lachnospiraceae bacterium]|nr:hypothetical protein [Lachnospiraceae bacterium]
MSDGKSIWKERLTDVDDDYLIGISNKGIVKRAYKDKEDTAAEIGNIDGEADVRVGEETVTVCFPLGESKCTCPSRSICRHVIQAILTLRENVTAENFPEPEKAAGEDSQPEKAAGGDSQPEIAEEEKDALQGKSAEKTGTHTGEIAHLDQTAVKSAEESRKAAEKKAAAQPELVTEKKEAVAQPEAATEKKKAVAQPEAATEKKKAAAQPEAATESEEAAENKGTGALSDKTVQQQAFQENADVLQGKFSARQEIPAVSAKVFREIEEFSMQTLKRTLGSRQFQNFTNQALSGIRPQIQYASVVTVRLPGSESGTEMVVKLLSPLEYSSCTCHKKELCVHKAAAIMWCRLEAGILTEEELMGEAAGELSYDMDKVKDAAAQMKLFLEELFGTGLSRTSPDVLDHMERLAVIGHNAGLAKFEGYFRALFDSYNRYFKRKAAFKTEELMGQMTRLYRRVKQLQQAKDSVEVGRYAGEFRAEYLPVGRLELIGIALEHFDSQSGYEGETIYFLEQNTKKWYTYTNARPVYYDNSRRRKFTEQGQAPWGLGISLNNLLKVRIRLIGAKCDVRQRLSASQDTRGEIIQEQKLTISDVENWYYRDFGELLSEQIGKRQRDWLVRDSSQEVAELVFVQPESCQTADFSQTKQQLSLPLYDEKGREVTVEVTYSKEEALTIRYLERLSGRKPPCFVGKLYFRGGKMCLYPLAVLEDFE